MAEVDLLSLLIPYGTHSIKVKARGTGYTDSDFSNSVTYVSKPICSRYNATTLRISNCRAAATSYEIYNGSNTLLSTESYSGADGGYLDVDVSSFGFTQNANNKVYCKAVVGGDNYQSDTIDFWYGASYVYGVSGLYQSEPALTRTDDATNLTWVMSNNEITSDFDTLFPYSEMTKQTVDGNAMVYVPAMYWRIGKDSNGYITDIAVSPTPISAGANQLTAHSEAFYYGAYGASYSGSIMQSVSGVSRRYSQTRAQFRTAAQNAGTGYQLIDVYHTRILEMLWLIEFATKNSEAVMWGYTSYGGSCGATDTLTSPSGQLANQGRMRWRYIEDFIGNGYEMFDGITGMYVTSNPAEYGDTQVGTLFSGSSLSNGYELSALGFADEENPLLIVPKVCVNNSSYNTYYCDQVYCQSGNYIYYRGRRNSTAYYGLFYWYGSAVSYSDFDLGSRLLKTL